MTRRTLVVLLAIVTLLVALAVVHSLIPWGSSGAEAWDERLLQERIR